MIFYILTGISLSLFSVSLLYSNRFLQPTLYAILTMTSVILLVIERGQFWLSYVVRYFLLFVSGFTLVLVPFFLLSTAIIMLIRMRKESELSLRERLFNYVIALTFMLFVAFTIWGFINLQERSLNAFINIYTLIALFFTANFISYAVMNHILNLWPIKKAPIWIIILGSKIEEIDVIPNTMRSRLDKAIQYYQSLPSQIQGKITFIVTGGLVGIDQLTEASVMEHYLIKQGIAKSQVVRDDQAKNTYENLKNVKQIINQSQGARDIFVVSSHYHLVRTHYFAHKLGLTVSLKGASEGVLSWPYSVVREFLAYFILNKEANFIYLLALTGAAILSVFQ